MNRIIRCLGAVLVLSLAALAQAGDVLRLQAGAPEQYVVKKGDTLWDISALFLKSPWRWPELWSYNRQIDNPHLIYPGDVLNLVWVDGQPRLVRADGSNGDVKLKPGMRISDLNNAIPAIPLEAIRAFLNSGRVVNNELLEAAPYILAGRDGHILAGVGDQAYARGDFDDNRVFGIFRKGQNYIDPETGELLGIEAKDIGAGKRVDLSEDIATLQINRSREELRQGDRLLPLEDYTYAAQFEPRAPSEDIKGFVIAVETGVKHIGYLDIVVLNKGEREAIKPGDVLAVYKTGELVRDNVNKEMVRLPDTRAGLVMVFRVFDKLSYALVLKARQSLAVGDKIQNP